MPDIPRDIRNRRVRNGEISMRVRAILVERFPAAFKPHGADKLPLKVSIDRDILLALPELGAPALALALADYTWGPSYCRHLTAEAQRYDLDGAPAGHVTTREAEHAAARLQMFASQKRQKKPEEGATNV